MGGEQVYPVPVLERGDSQRLFVARARAALPEFQPDEHVDELCARLDDLPLAIELAAARTPLLTTAQLLERLGKRLDLLRGGRDAEVRQRTLRATIEWSYELLSAEEQELLAALSVFQGGWTLELAERVCEADVELLESLVDKSLVRRIGSGRLFMLETIREFAGEQLELERRDELMGRLLDVLPEVFEEANLRPESIGPPAMALAQEERANVEVALEWATEAGEANRGLHLLWMLEMYWVTNDPVGARERLEALLERAPDELDPAVHARALRLRGATFDLTGRFDLSEQEYVRAIDAFSDLGDEEQVAHLRHRIANSALQCGEVERAVALTQEALEGDRRRGDIRGQAIALNVLAEAAFTSGEREEGVRLGYESVALAEQVGFTWWRALTLLQISDWLVLGGELDRATASFRPGLEAIFAVHDYVNLPYALATGAALAAALGDSVRAGTLWGAVEGIADREPRPTTARVIAEYGPRVEPVQGEEFERARAYGRTLSLEQAVDYALTNLD